VNYLKEINAFHHWLETNQCDATEQALWFHLMDINNRCGWSVWFQVANLTLQAKLGGIDRKTLDRKRNNLKLLERIEYVNLGKREAGKYRMISFEGINPLKEDITGNIPVENTITGNIPLETGLTVPKNGLNLTTLYKLNKTKLKDNIYSVFAHWNSKGIITHKSLSDKMKGHINARLEKFTPEEIMEAIDNYAMVLHGEEYFWSYKWGLGEFLTRENGFEKFLSVNKPLVNYLKKGGQADASNRGNSKNTDVDWDNYDPDASRWTDE